MASRERESIHELAAGYALGALDEDDRRVFDDHIAGCESCREELGSLLDSAAALALAEEGPEPPPGLRARVLAAVHEEAAKVVPITRRRWRVPSAVALAVAACLALGLGLWATLGPGGSRAREPQSLPLNGAPGRLAISRTGHATLTVNRLAPPPAGKTYEVWVIRNGNPEPAALFPRGGSNVSVTLQKMVPKGSTVAVTLERAGGVPKPTGKPLFSVAVTA
jgi:anti-sigma-K factor RskA